MSDGVMCPNLHDGMAVVDEWPTKNDDDRHENFDGRYQSNYNKGGRSGRDRNGNDRWDDDDKYRSSRLVLVRNHETGNGVPYVDRPAITYANDGAGGTTNLLFDARKGKWLEAWSSLAGTVRNCAGAVTPWGTWISQEETTNTGHGWSFEVGATKDCSIGGPTPLHDMGRFSHEASMVDPKTGFVYQTEDSGDCGFYRFVPYSRGKLVRGGKLYMMSVKDNPAADLGGGIPVGTTWDVRWVRIDDPAALVESCFGQGRAKGGARFRRLEGAWWGDGVGYFVSTDGGSAREGQLFQYDPRDETLTLIYQSRRRSTIRTTLSSRRAVASFSAKTPQQQRTCPPNVSSASRRMEKRSPSVSTTSTSPWPTTAPSWRAIIAVVNGRAPATVPMGAGCSSTSRRPVLRSRLPVRGDEGRSEVRAWRDGRRGICVGAADRGSRSAAPFQPAVLLMGTYLPGLIMPAGSSAFLISRVTCQNTESSLAICVIKDGLAR
jgi:hypothetical protein